MYGKRTLGKLATISMVVAFLGGLLLIFAGIATAQEAPSIVGSETCLGCHEELAAGFEKSLHAQAWRTEGSGYQTAGCETCHGPGGQHAENPAKDTIVTFGPESLQDAEQRNARCLECHASVKELALWDMGEHRRNDVACTDCHDIHGGSRPAVDQPEVCFTCHKDVRFDSSKQSHHPIVEGKVACSDCHNPHGALSHGMIRAENTNQLCYTCHADKRGPFMWEHPPVEEDCAICHEPHGSRHNKLMIEKIPNLCQDCHDWSRHPGTAYDAQNGFAGSAGNRFIARSCLNCHGTIHGSTAPTNPSSGYNAGEFLVR